MFSWFTMGYILDYVTSYNQPNHTAYEQYTRHINISMYKYILFFVLIMFIYASSFPIYEIYLMLTTKNYILSYNFVNKTRVSMCFFFSVYFNVSAAYFFFI